MISKVVIAQREGFVQLMYANGSNLTANEHYD